MRLAFVLLLIAPLVRAEDDAAKVHFLSGQAYYDQANYEDALREFGEAYRISKKPALLYNLAVCHEHLNHFDEAVTALRQYLEESPNAADRASIEERIKNLERQQEKVVAAPVPVAPPPPPPPVVEKPRARVATWVVGGLGVGLLLGAVASGTVAYVRYNNLQNDCGGGFSCPNVADLDARKTAGKNAALATDVLWPIGVAAVVTAIVLYFYEIKKPAARASLEPVIRF
jgi:tetratricopeptide (TPR) repeat protein